MIFQDDLTEYKNGEDIISPLQMLAFIHPTTVDQEPSQLLAPEVASASPWPPSAESEAPEVASASP